MLSRAPSRRFPLPLLLAACFGVPVAAQLPAIQPTSPASAVAPLAATPAQPDAATRAHRADVRYDGALLTVNAQNSSLNQILREIARQTGMKITGGVRDERVFGHYGPATPSVILDTLIDSNTTNLVLRQTASAAPAELILTPRNGGPTPPNPNAPGFDDGDDAYAPPAPQFNGPPPPRGYRPGNVPYPPANANMGNGTAGTYGANGSTGNATGSMPSNPASSITPVSSGPQPINQPLNNPMGNPANTTPTAGSLPTTNSVPLDAISTPSTVAPAPQGIVDSPNPIPAGTVNPIAAQAAANGAANSTGTNNQTTPALDTSSPTGAATPEQIFEQLQRLRQQHQPQTGTPPTTPTSPQ